MVKKNTMICFRLDENLYDEIEKVSKNTGMQKSEIVRLILTNTFTQWKQLNLKK